MRAERMDDASITLHSSRIINEVHRTMFKDIVASKFVQLAEWFSADCSLMPTSPSPCRRLRQDVLSSEDPLPGATGISGAHTLTLLFWTGR